MAATHQAYLHASLSKLEKRLPRFGARAITWLRGASAWVRAPLALLLIVGGFFGFLPVLGYWMIPLGVVLIALDVPFLQAPLAALFVRVERWWTR